VQQAPGLTSARSVARSAVSMVAIHASCSHPVPETGVFSKLLASLRDRPSMPCATSTRHAWAMGRNVEDLSGHPTRRTSRPCLREMLPAAFTEVPLSTRTTSSRRPWPEATSSSTSSSVAVFSVVDAGTTHAANGSPVTSTATARLAPFVRPYGPPRSWKVTPPLDAPRARCVSMTTRDGSVSARPSSVRACACNPASARAQVPFAAQRRNCDHARVHGPNSAGRNLHWQPVWVWYSRALTMPRRSLCLRPGFPDGHSRGPRTSHASSLTSVG
jgi:hypothetical protein